MGEPILETQNLTIGYSHRRRPARVVAAGISVSLFKGELVCLLGPNGAGKSTLMRTLAGMQRPLDGTVRLSQTDINRFRPRELARRLSIVLTDRVEVGALSVYTLVALGRYPFTNWSGRLKAEDEHIVRWALDLVGATSLTHRLTHELSDGERQKAMIARALAQEPALMLLDEPTAFLDLPRRVDIMGILRRLARDTDCAILLATHDLDLALRSADRLWLLPMGGPVQSGAPEDLVLNGAFQAVFQNEDIEFDPYSGSFKLHRQRAGEVALKGTGLPALWTERALQRSGFCVHRQAGHCPIQVQVTDHAGNPSWTVHIQETSMEYHSLYEVITRLTAWTSGH